MNRQMAEALLGVTHPPYGWIIDEWPDVEDIGPIEPAGTVFHGPSAIKNETLDRLNAGEGRAFRMLDDDGLVYCHGRIITRDEDAEGEVDFQPLHDLGEAYGCTEIHYRNANNQWEQL